ncbi:phage holin family protein [Cohnella abietis]|uniref:Holin n=1 Tax=Cohnella abietis TaxID=2507935 RepID=A0A3T1D1T5_9BACL|nr:phage holin family protein [Cohnella abietis]BBI32060.1 hypothetical protein KCTCHS21_14590 [Cohnella abietis]
MEWNAFFQLIDPQLFIVVAACWVLGFSLKRTPIVEDWTIVYIVTIAAVLLAVWLIGFSPESVIQGVLAGAFAVYGHQMIKQTTKVAENESEDSL